MSPLSASLIFPSLKVLERKVANAASSHPLGNITLQEFARCVFEMTKMEIIIFINECKRCRCKRERERD